MPAILLIRHAQASYGSADYDVLAGRAKRQTAALRAHFAARGVDESRVVVATGPRRRHRDTAQQVWPDVRAVVHQGWDEYSTNDVLERHGPQRQSFEELSAVLPSIELQDQLDVALARWTQDTAGTWPAFDSGVRDALSSLVERVPSGGIGVAFTSAGAIAASAAAALGAPSAFVALNRVQVNTGVTKLVAGRQGVSLITFNEHAHLEAVDFSLITHR